jgi:hypothetical protein
MRIDKLVSIDDEIWCTVDPFEMVNCIDGVCMGLVCVEYTENWRHIMDVDFFWGDDEIIP